MWVENKMSRRVVRTLGIVSLAVVMGLVTGACRGKGDTALDPDLTSSGGRTGPEETTIGENLPQIDENWLFNEFTGLAPVYFDFDSYDLRSDALATLRENAEKVRQVPDAIIQIEGHCDERGTQDYNLALGEKRALATRAHLINLGVSGDRIITISYGEEDPADSGQNEDAWAKNRRCEFNRAM